MRLILYISIFMSGVSSLAYSQSEQFSVSYNRTSNVEKATTLLADVDGPLFGISYRMSGNKQQSNDEKEKCQLLFEIGSEDPAATFDGAVSDVLLTLNISESRNESTIGKAWLESLLNLSNAEGIEFDELTELEYFLPVVTDLSVETILKQSDSISSSIALNYINNAITRMFAQQTGGQIENFRSKGVLNVKSDEQVIVCAFLLLNEVELQINVDGRILDRTLSSSFLGEKCLEKTIKYAANEYFTKFHGTVGSDGLDLSFLLGTLARATPKTIGIYNDSPILCQKKLNEKKDVVNALKGWKRITDMWKKILSEKPDGNLSQSNIIELVEIGKNKEIIRTQVKYGRNYILNLDV